MNTERLLWAPRAWVGGRWRERVLLEIGSDGCWAFVMPDSPIPADARQLPGPVLPGLVNAHSHAFQRAFAGLTERRQAGHDDFWSWRERMYQTVARMTPALLGAIAAQLFAELLRGGYTQVCEFHYLHHQPDGTPYDDPLAFSWALAEAAAETGIGLTLLPALYERAGFARPELRTEQRRFAAGVETILSSARRIAAAARPLVNAGVAVHSLRAAGPDSIRKLADGAAGPLHIHVAEQQAEVAECLAACGARPVEWLAREGLLDRRWQLVHATHVVAEEIEAVARAGAGLVLCPATEANLGDGLTDLPRWLAAGVQPAIGSDSQVNRDWRDELCWLEYGQRLQLRRRNVAAAPESGQPAVAAHLWQSALDAGARAAGFPAWGLVAGARADLLVADPEDEATLAVPGDRWLDALVFSSPARPFGDVLVGGRWVLRGGHAHAEGARRERFAAAMQELWSDDGLTSSQGEYR